MNLEQITNQVAGFGRRREVQSGFQILVYPAMAFAIGFNSLSASLVTLEFMTTITENDWRY